MSTLLIAAKIMGDNLKEDIRDFFCRERGGSEIIATIVLIAIVVLLAVLFKDQIGNLVNNMWNDINTNSQGLTNTPIGGGTP